MISDAFPHEEKASLVGGALVLTDNTGSGDDGRQNFFSNIIRRYLGGTDRQFADCGGTGYSICITRF